MKSSLKPWQGIVATIVAALGSQLAGGVLMLAGFALLVVLRGPEVVANAPMSALPFWAVATSTIALQGTLAFVAVMTPVLARVRVDHALSLRSPRWWTLALAPVGAIALGPFADFLMQCMHSLVVLVSPDWQGSNIQMILGLARDNPWWATVPLIAFIPGFAEELLFRGMLQRSLGSGWPALLIASIAFAMFHLDPVHVAGVLPVGIYLGWLLKRTGSLWVPIAAHVGNNAFSLFAANIDSFDVGYGTASPMPWWWFVVGAGFFSAVVATVAFGRGPAVSPDAEIE